MRSIASVLVVGCLAAACSKGGDAHDSASAMAPATATGAAAKDSMGGMAGMGHDADRAVAGGGITAAGWQGKADKGNVADSKFAMDGSNIAISTGPAATYWNPANTATGSYEIKSSFTEHKQNASHPHSYGLFIGGSDLGTDQQAYAYCIAYGDGTYSMKYFHGNDAETVADRVANAAIHKAGPDGTVTNEIGWRVKGDKASCVINGTEVGSWPASQLTGAGKLKSLGGTYGVRVAHNIDVTMTPIAKM